MIDYDKIEKGDKVYYKPEHYSQDEWENGIVKEVPDHRNDAVRVVYNCNEEWDRYEEYTSAMTRIEDLFYGWKTRLKKKR